MPSDTDNSDVERFFISLSGITYLQKGLCGGLIIFSSSKIVFCSNRSEIA